MKILVTGSTGLVGSQLVPALAEAGHAVVRLVRRAPNENEIEWDPANNRLDPADLEGFDGVVHLAGDGIADGRWNAKKKQRIRDSRVGATRLLCEALATCHTRAATLVSASAVGWYGDRGAEVLDETSAPGDGFLAEVCQQWEAATAEASANGIRVVSLRIGVVLSPNGGAIQKMLTPFRLGLGGRVGSGRQFWSWIAIDDLVGAIGHALVTPQLSGPVNAVAPNPISNLGFTKALGHVLGRPTCFPMPAFVARMLLGEMAEGLLLASANVQPKRLLQSGYAFRHPELEPALRAILDV